MFYIRNLQDTKLTLLSVFSSDYDLLYIMPQSLIENSPKVHLWLQLTDNTEVINYKADAHNVLGQLLWRLLLLLHSLFPAERIIL